MNTLSLFHFLLNAYNIVPPLGKYIAWRGSMISRFLNKSGNNLKVASRVNIYDPSKLSCGNNVYIGYNTYIGGGEVILDDEVIIGPFCCIVAGNHTQKDGSYRFGKYQYGKIEIGRGTWLGAHATITANVRIGKGCVIAANAVVCKDVPDFTMVGGVPAKVIKKLGGNG